MKRKPRLLVLDGQGVVFDAPIKKFLHTFSQYNELDYAAVVDRWESRLRYLAWTGAIDDETLWTELAGTKVDVEQTKQLHIESYRPGPVASLLQDWAQLLPIWLLSNHRSHWVSPQLDALNVTDAFQRLLVSDSTGIVKPDPNAFSQLLDGSLAPGDMLFVDDQLHNTRAAEDAGLQTIHASPGSAWVEAIGQRIRD